MTTRYLALSDPERARVERVEELARAGAGGVAALIDLLVDPSWAVRRAVVSALARAGRPAVAPLSAILVQERDNEARLAAAVDALVAVQADVDSAMLSLLETDSPPVLCDAVQVLGRRHSRSALGRLAELSTHADDNVAVAAIEALGRLGDLETVTALIAAVEAKHFFRTFPAIDALGRTGDVRAVKPLADLLKDPLYVGEAARALGRTGQEQAIVPLASLLSKPSDAVVRTAALALADLRERYEARFGETPAMARALPDVVDGATSSRVIAALAGLGPSEVVAITRVLSWIGDPPSIARLIELVVEPEPIGGAAGEGLRRIGSRAAASILAAVADGNSTLRARLLPIVAAASVPGQALVVCLEDSEPDVRAKACEALARLGDTSAVPALFRLLGDRDPRVSQGASAAIQSLGSLDTKRLALEQARSSDARTRRAALRILSYFGYPEGLEILVDAMSDPDEKIREAAIYGLPLLEHPKAVQALLANATHPEARTRAAIARALGQTSSEPAVVEVLHAALADTDGWVRYYAVQSLGRLKHDGAAAWLVERMSDASGQVRVAAVEALAYLAVPSAEAALLTAARSEDSDMRRAALVGLGISRRPTAIPLLREGSAADDPATRLVAIGALAEFDSPEVVPTLAHAVSDPDEVVRSAAVGHLATRPTEEATLALLAQLENVAMKTRVLDALAVGADERIEAVLSALETADAAHAELFVTALVRMRRPSSHAALSSVLATANMHARRAAAAALAAIATPSAKESLARAGASDPDPEVRRICATISSAP